MTEIDRDVFEALSSETRTQILKELGRRGTTPTFLSQRLGKHKSTIVEHLRVLQESGLVSRESIEGRKRVVYSLTTQGRRLVVPQTTVTLVLSSMVLSFILGLGAFATFFFKDLVGGSILRSSTNSPELLMKATDTLEEAALTYGGTTAVQTVGNYVPFLYAGLILIMIGLLSYSYWKRRT